jgi:glutamine cyclotransferase
MTRTTKELITSDGPATLRFRDPNTFRETRHILVRDGGKIISQLNELEFIKGEICANVWHSDRIARISPQDGHVSHGSTSPVCCLPIKGWTRNRFSTELLTIHSTTGSS